MRPAKVLGRREMQEPVGTRATSGTCGGVVTNQARVIKMVHDAFRHIIRPSGHSSSKLSQASVYNTLAPLLSRGGRRADFSAVSAGKVTKA